MAIRLSCGPAPRLNAPAVARGDGDRAGLVAGRVRGGGIGGRLVGPIHFTFLGDTLAIVVSLSLSGSFCGTGSSIRLSFEREAAAFLCKLGRESWCRLCSCREGASDDQGQRAQSSQNRRHGTPFIVVGAILLSRRRIAASIPVISVAWFSNDVPKSVQSCPSCTKFGFTGQFPRHRA